MEATAASYSSASNNDGILIRPLFPAMPWLNADGSSLPMSNAGSIASKSKAEDDRNEEDGDENGDEKDGGEEEEEEEEDDDDDEDNDCDDDDDDEEEEVSSALVAISVGLTHCREALERGSIASLLEEEDENRAEGGAETPSHVSLLPDRHSLVGCVSKASSATTNCSHFVGSRASGSASKEEIADSAQVVWTDGKHDLYLNLMEANFVRNMYNHGYCYLDLCGKQPQQHIESTEESLQSHENNSTSSDVCSFLNRGHSNWMDITASRVDKEACAQNELHPIRDSSLDVKKKRGYASNCEERPRKMSIPTSKSSFQSSFSDQVVPCPCADGVERIGSIEIRNMGKVLIDPSSIK